VHPNQSPLKLTCGTRCFTGPTCHPPERGTQRGTEAVFFPCPSGETGDGGVGLVSDDGIADGDGEGDMSTRVPTRTRGGLNHGRRGTEASWPHEQAGRWRPSWRRQPSGDTGPSRLRAGVGIQRGEGGGAHSCGRGASRWPSHVRRRPS
jgi:hypothetical protein